MWDVNTGHVIKQRGWTADIRYQKPETNLGMTRFVTTDAPMPPSPIRPVQFDVCKNCGHEIRWQRVAVPPRWEHTRVMSGDESSRLFWICECGCMTPEPKEATS